MGTRMEALRSRIARSAGAVVVALAVTCAVPALAKPPGDEVFDPSTVGCAGCDGTVYGSDGADLMTARPAQSLTGLARMTASRAPRAFCLVGGDGNDTLT